MSIFDRLDNMVSRAVDFTQGDRVLITPMVAPPNGRPIPDTARAQITCIGVFDYVYIEHGLELGVRKSYREANDLRALQGGREPQVSIDRKYFPSSVVEPRQGDWVVILNKPDLPRFEVSSVQRDGMSRLVIMLVAQGSHA